MEMPNIDLFYNCMYNVCHMFCYLYVHTIILSYVCQSHSVCQPHISQLISYPMFTIKMMSYIKATKQLPEFM